MNVLQITNRLPFPLNDGGNIATYHVTQYLHRFGHKVTLASLNTRKHYADPKALASVADVHTVDIDTTITMGGLLKNFFSSVPYNVSRFVNAEFEALLARLLHEKTFDVVQLEGIYLAVYLPVIRKHTKAPVVLRAHNVEHHIWQRLALREPSLPKRLYMKYLAGQIRRFEETQACKFDGVVAITEKDASWFARFCPKRNVKAIPAGVHLHQSAAQQMPRLSPSVAILGSLEWAPNVQGLEWFLAEVWPRVISQLPTVTLYVAGKNPPEELMYRVEPNVQILGMVPDAAAFLAKHPVLAVPLHAGGGMRLKVVEAMAMGRCIVSTTIGSEGIPAQHGEHLLLADSAADFAEALLQVLTDNGLRAELGSKAYALAAEKYGWEGLVRKFEEFYRELP